MDAVASICKNPKKLFEHLNSLRTCIKTAV